MSSEKKPGWRLYQQALVIQDPPALPCTPRNAGWSCSTAQLLDSMPMSTWRTRAADKGLCKPHQGVGCSLGISLRWQRRCWRWRSSKSRRKEVGHDGRGFGWLFPRGRASSSMVLPQRDTHQQCFKVQLMLVCPLERRLMTLSMWCSGHDQPWVCQEG